MKKHDIPIQEPGFSIAISFDRDTWEIADIEMDWKKFLELPQIMQIDHLKYIIEEVEKSPTKRKEELRMAEKRAGKAWIQ